MRIYSKIVEIENEVINLALPEDYNFKSPIRQHASSEDDDPSIHFEISVIYTSGLCIRESNYRIFKNVNTHFINEGEHIDFFFYLKGKSRVDNIHLAEVYDEEIGVGRRSYIGHEGQQGSVEFKSNNHIRFIMIAMSKDFFINLLLNEPWLKDDRFAQDILSGNVTTKYDDNFTITHPMLNVLNDLLHGNHIKTNKRHFIEMKLKELLLNIHEQRLLSVKNVLIKDEVFKTLESIKAYLIQNYHQPPTILKLSRLFLINEKSLKKYFKIMYGTTIHAYIINVRMEKAYEMILKDYTVNEVANTLGYHSVSHFIKTFKSFYGCTPKGVMVNLYKG